MDLKQGDLENLIINALWDLEGDPEAGTPSARVYVGDVQEHIRSTTRKWAYTTVKTVLDRLVDKDHACRHKDGKRFYYQSLVSRGESGRQAVRKLVRQYFQGDVDSLLACIAQLRREEGDGFANPTVTAPAAVPSAAQLSREFHTHLIKRSYENAPAGERFVRRTPAASTPVAPAAAAVTSYRSGAFHDDVPILIGAGRARQSL